VALLGAKAGSEFKNKYLRHEITSNTKLTKKV
jgi:hypothetical protein